MHDLEKLRIFYYVARELNIGRAAEKLGIASPSVSKYMKLLEESLSQKLIKRKRYGVALTEFGKKFFNQIAPSISNLNNVLEPFSSDNIASNSVKILTTDGVLSSIVSKEISNYINTNGFKDVEFVINSQKKPNLLESSEDFGILPLQTKTKGISQTLILKLHSRLYAHKDYVKKHGAPKNIKDLENHILIGYSSERLYSSVNPDWYLERGAAASKRHAILKVNSTSGQFEALMAAVGILGISKEFPLLKYGDLVEILPDEKEQVFSVCFVKREDEKISSLEHSLCDFLKEKFKNYASM